MTVLIFTGLMISESALPALGIQLGEGMACLLYTSRCV